MLLIKEIRDNRDRVKERLRKRAFANTEWIDEIIELDERRRGIKAELDDFLNKAKTRSKEIGQLYKTGRRAEAEQLKGEMALIKDRVKLLEDDHRKLEEQIEEILLRIPNLPHDSVPAGTTDADNVVLKEGGSMPSLPENALTHWELAEKYDLIRFEEGTKITGSGFPVFSGMGARLQRALVNFFLDRAIRAGYHEFSPPLLVNKNSAFATGQLPDKDGQMYYINEDDLYLIPTAEVPLTNLFRDKILKEEDLPQKLVGYTPCFRREAGSYGKDVRGLNRLHQFDKVEIVQIAHPEKSYEVLEQMMEHVEWLIKELELPYRVLRLCGGDLGFTSALTFDFEVYSAAQHKWLEVSSVSNFETFQSKRLKLRFKDNEGKNQLLHTLNGSALAFPRIIAAVLENNQTKSGIKMPEALRPYLGFDEIT
jgi:seryl-tRNA synthetase